MPNQVQKLCDALMEAAWLAALVVVPLYFNVFSQRVFEPDKIALLRSLALVALVAWVVKQIDRFGQGEEAPAASGEAAIPLWRRPLALPVLALAAVYLISTVLSVTPRQSFWGSYQRLQGTFTMFSYIILFFVTLDTLRTSAQWRRLQYAILLTSVPIALYGIFQLEGIQLDPLPWGGDTSQRVAGNMGNAIFLAAYLIMALPLTVERLISAGQKMLLDAQGSTADALTAGVLLFVLLLQAAAIFFTQSRGPWLGLAAGGYIFLLLGLTSLRQQAPRQGPLLPAEYGLGAGMGVAGLALLGLGILALLRIEGLGGGLILLLAGLGALALYLIPLFNRRGWRWLWLSVITQGVLIGLFLILINLPNTALHHSFAQIPRLGRLAQIMEVEGGTGRVRVLIWQGVIDMLAANEPLTFPDGHTDALGRLRVLLGNGPESMWVAYNRYYLPELGGLERRNASPDRSHNETFDSLVITGVVGFAAYFLLFVSVLYHALRWLGLMAGRRDRILFLALALAGALAGVALPALGGALHLAGVGMPFGFILGVILYVTYAAAQGTAAIRSLDRRHLLIVALLATVVAHFIEIHSGISIAATRTYFFLLIGALAAVGSGQLRLAEDAAPAAQPAPPPPPARGKRRSPAKRSPGPQRPSREERLPLWRAALPFILIGSLILFVLDYIYIANQAATRDTLGIFLQSWQPGRDNGMLWILLFTLIVGLALAVGETWRPHHRRQEIGSVALTYVAGALMIWLIYGLFQAGRLRPISTALSLIERGDQVAGHVNAFYVWLGLLTAGLAAGLWLAGERAGKSWGRRPAWVAGAAAGLSIAALYLIITVNLNLVRADVYFKIGQNADGNRDWQTSQLFYERATALAPREDHYKLFLGRSLLEGARAAADAAQQQALFDRAEQILLDARALNPLNTDHSANLARYYATRAAAPFASGERQTLLQKAAAAYAVATTLSPNAAHLQNEWGSVYMQLGDTDAARARYAHSITLDPNYADTYLRLAQLEGQQEAWAAALAAYTRAAELNPNDIRAHSGRGFALAQLGRAQEAIAANLQVLTINPNDASTLQNLTVLYRDAGDLAQALLYARRLREVAPESQIPSIDALIQQLQQQVGG